MKQTVRIAGGISELFGTLDENLKLFESSLHVTTHLKDHDLEIEGEPAQVERAARILDEYNQRIRDGRIPNSQEVKSLLRVATAELPQTNSRRVFAYAHPIVRQEKRRAEEPEPAALHRSAGNLRHGVRHWSGRNREKHISPSRWRSPRCFQSR